VKDAMKILGESILRGSDYLNIHELQFLADNPRVYACTHGEANFDKKTPEEQQQIIYEKLLKEPSVKNLIPEIKRHGGLMEHILVRMDTMQVIEGNSRLAVYRKLHESNEMGDWELIPCDTVSRLSDEQQTAYLNQIHVKGKTQWLPYEKANFAYVRKQFGWSVGKIAKVFGESERTIYSRINVIEMMKKHHDIVRSHYSFYEVLARTPEIKERIEQGELKRLLSDIKRLGENQEEDDFTAGEMRKKLPVVLNKPRVLKKYERRVISLDEAYQRAKTSRAEDKIKQATALLDEVQMSDIQLLEQNEINALKQAVKKHQREVKRIDDIIGSRLQ